MRLSPQEFLTFHLAVNMHHNLISVAEAIKQSDTPWASATKNVKKIDYRVSGID